MKHAYIVHGSEDGIIGVYTSSKKAHSAALVYINEWEGGQEHTITTIDNLYQSTITSTTSSLNAIITKYPLI
jgi:hypothetical protein